MGDPIRFSLFPKIVHITPSFFPDLAGFACTACATGTAGTGVPELAKSKKPGMMSSYSFREKCGKSDLNSRRHSFPPSFPRNETYLHQGYPSVALQLLPMGKLYPLHPAYLVPDCLITCFPSLPLLSSFSSHPHWNKYIRGTI
jgi:hypothetical protein